MDEPAGLLRRFLLHPTGWLLFQLVEWLLVIAILRPLEMRLLRKPLVVNVAVIVLVIALLTLANYAVRRRFLERVEGHPGG